MNAPTFWCHECQATITPNNMNCPTCGGGFIEPLDSGDGSRPQDYEIPGAQPQQPGRTQSYAQGEQANYAPGFGPFQELWQFLRNPAISGQAGTGQGQRGTQVFTHTFHLGNGGNVQAVGQMMQQVLGLNIGPMGGSGGFVQGDYVFGNMQDIINRLFQQHEAHTPAASKKAIEDLPRRPINKEDVDQKKECSVCQSEYTEGEEVLELPCQHLFHEECITPWLKMNNSCPVCRYALPREGEDGTERK